MNRGFGARGSSPARLTFSCDAGPGGAGAPGSGSWKASFRSCACIGAMNRDEAAAGALASWTAAVLCRFCARGPDPKAPEDWRTPKPRRCAGWFMERLPGRKDDDRTVSGGGNEPQLFNTRSEEHTSELQS